MSAESPRRGVHKGAQIVSPQPIVDRSIIDSVAGIINDIVPQGYAGVSNSDNRETISWARFEYADINDPALYPDYNEGSSTPPLLLVLGYAVGVQVWLIAATGEATEVLSWRQGVVRTLRILPNPKTDDEHVDEFEAKRPMVAICSELDSTLPGPKFCDVNFISLKTGEPVHSVAFKNPVCDVLANRRSVVVTLLEKIAVFDARTLQNNITITTCYASPGPNPNPVALGTRWLAYSEKKLIPVRRSSGGCEGEGVQSYTATVLYAAKSLGKGLRGLGETVASSLTGNSVSPMVANNTGNDVTQPGVVTILDLQVARDEKELDDANAEAVIAHFTAHSDAIVAMTFDLTGALLMTADKRGHDFHVFKIQPHPGGPTLAAVHHLYILHRGDTTAKVQDMVFSSDTRWAAVSTVRGTTHVFPVAPYGGPVGVRTHSTPHVVNRLSRFHRSAGLTDDSTRSHSPVSHAELPLSVYPYSNPRLPPYPHPTILHPLSQIRQPSSLNQVNSSSQPRPQQRQRLHSDDNGTLPLKICACFAPPRAWMYAQRESSSKVVKRAVDSLFIMACHGNMIQYDLEPKAAAGVPKEKVCDDTMIELEVEAKGQWPLCRSPNSTELAPPLPLSNPLLNVSFAPKNNQELDTAEDRWLSQVEIVTHAGPHRRLWMGPQFVFKTYNAPSGVAVNLVEAEAVEIGVTGSRPARSKPVNMPHAASRPLMPVVIDGSGSSYEQSPRFMEAYGDPLESENAAVGSCESQLREDLAEAMLEISIASHRAPGRRTVVERVGQPVTKVVNPHTGTVITVSADEDEDTISGDSAQDSAAEEIHAPRSVCAEEGPASLGGAADLADVEPASRALSREHTEICAEMRTACEPAIDSVPDENIRELQERRALCAEMATTTTASIDYEREEAFRDVPTSLSLCAEPGEIPSSPMTQAKETLWCGKSKGADKRGDDYHSEVHERHLAKAKYFVSYDDDSVTLMENKTMRSDGDTAETPAPHTSADEKLKKLKKRSIADSEKASSRGSSSDLPKRPVEQRVATSAEKYRIKEDDYARKVYDACTINIIDNIIGKKSEATKTRKGGESKSRTPSDEKELKYAKEKLLVKPHVRGIPIDVVHKEETSKATKAGSPADCHDDDDDDDDDDDGLPPLDPPPLDPPPLDDFRSIGYHAEEPCNLGKDTASTQSDDDLEHIHASDVMQSMRSRIENAGGGCEDATATTGGGGVTQRKSSKSTISDDDLEYIQSSELGALDSASFARRASSDSRTRRRHSRHTLSSDDDLEHVQHSEIHELELDASTRFAQEASLTTMITEQLAKSKSEGKRRKDIMVIEKSDAEATAEVTVIYNPLEEIRPKPEEIDKCDYLKERPEGMYLSPTRKPKSRSSKPTSFSSSSSSSSLSSSKRTSQSTVSDAAEMIDMIEIIDIDAMQKAETDADAAPECKILPAAVAAGTRARKSRKSKKSQESGSSESFISAPLPLLCSSKVKMAELQEAVQEEPLVDFTNNQESKAQVASSAEISWSSIVKKSISSSLESQEARKEMDLEPLIEVEEKQDDARKFDEAESRDEDDSSSVGSRRRASKAKEEEERLSSEKDNVDETTTTTTTTMTTTTMTTMTTTTTTTTTTTVAAMEDSFLIDLPTPIVDEEPRVDEDIAAVVSVTARARKIRQSEEDNVTMEKSSLVTTEVRSVVVDETRRGNVAAVRRESQRESSLQLQPQRQVESGDGGGSGGLAESERHDSSIAKKENPGSELVETTGGRRNEAPNESQSKKTLEEAAARKANNRSKRKKRR
ncbi:microtubule-associated protein futsch isoform X2 [Linepithema humile]|uniref:microtubule-associated protein futsch isoform X2 n=1 Tax=Linepithema humile TaxID=83485 RepID=UPI00351F2F23